MKRLLMPLLLLSLIILLLGCGMARGNQHDGQDGQRGEMGITGYVMARENERILVVSTEPKDFSSTGGEDEFYDAIWFSSAPKDIELGDKVRVWYDIVMESYPGQSEVDYIEKIPTEKPKGASLTESQALNKALTSKDLQNEAVGAVKSLEYNHETGLWNIQIKDLLEEDRVYSVRVEDK